MRRYVPILIVVIIPLLLVLPAFFDPLTLVRHVVAHDTDTVTDIILDHGDDTRTIETTADACEERLPPPSMTIVTDPSLTPTSESSTLPSECGDDAPPIATVASCEQALHQSSVEPDTDDTTTVVTQQQREEDDTDCVKTYLHSIALAMYDRTFDAFTSLDSCWQHRSLASMDTRDNEQLTSRREQANVLTKWGVLHAATAARAIEYGRYHIELSLIQHGVHTSSLRITAATPFATLDTLASNWDWLYFTLNPVTTTSSPSNRSHWFTWPMNERRGMAHASVFVAETSCKLRWGWPLTDVFNLSDVSEPDQWFNHVYGDDATRPHQDLTMMTDEPWRLLPDLDERNAQRTRTKQSRLDCLALLLGLYSRYAWLRHPGSSPSSTSSVDSFTTSILSALPSYPLGEPKWSQQRGVFRLLSHTINSDAGLQADFGRFAAGTGAQWESFLHSLFDISMRFTYDYLGKPATSLPPGKYRDKAEWRARPNGLPVIASAFAWQETARKSVYYLAARGHEYTIRLAKYLMFGWGDAISDNCQLPHESWHDAPYLFRHRMINFTNQCFGKQNIMEFALRLQPNIEHADTNGWRALHHAASTGNHMIVTALLKAGAAMHARTTWQQTPLHIAVLYAQIQPAIILLMNGARIGLKDRWGRTVMDIMYIHRYEWLHSEKVLFCDTLRIAYTSGRDKLLKSHRDKIKAGIKTRSDKEAMDDEEAESRAAEKYQSCIQRLIMDESENIFEEDADEEIMRYNARHALDAVYLDRRGFAPDDESEAMVRVLAKVTSSNGNSNSGWSLIASESAFPYDHRHNNHPRLSSTRFTSLLTSLSLPPSPWSGDGMRTMRQQRDERVHERAQRHGNDRLRSGGWNHVRHGAQCDIDVVHRRDINYDTLLSKYIGAERPVLVRGMWSHDDNAVTQTTRSSLLARYGHVNVTRISVSQPLLHPEASFDYMALGHDRYHITLEDYLMYMNRIDGTDINNATSPLEWYDTPDIMYQPFKHDPLDHIPSDKTPHPLAELFPQPSLLRPPNKEDAPLFTPHQSHMYVGPVNSGQAMHYYHYHSWNGLMHGRIHWVMFPPRFAMTSSMHPHRWLSSYYPYIHGGHECIQHAGDWLYIPNGWSMASLHLSDSVGFAARFAGARFDATEFTFEHASYDDDDATDDDDKDKT